MELWSSIVPEFSKPGRISIIFGDYGTGKSTLAFQVIKEHWKSDRGTIFLLSGTQLTVNRLDEILGTPLPPVPAHFLKIVPITDFTGLIKAISILELTLRDYLDKLEITRAPMICIDSFTRPYLLEQATEKKRFKMNERLSWVMAWLKKIALEYDIPVLLTCEERVRESDKILDIAPAGGSVVKYWGDKFCHLIRKVPDASRLMVFYSDPQGHKEIKKVLLGSTGFRFS